MLVQLRGSRLMDPAGLSPAIRALHEPLRGRGGLAGAMGYSPVPDATWRPRRCRLSVAAGPAQLGDVPMAPASSTCRLLRRSESRIDSGQSDATTEI